MTHKAYRSSLRTSYDEGYRDAVEKMLKTLKNKV